MMHMQRTNDNDECIYVRRSVTGPSYLSKVCLIRNFYPSVCICAPLTLGSWRGCIGCVGGVHVSSAVNVSSAYDYRRFNTVYG